MLTLKGFAVTTATTLAPEDREMLDLHELVMEKYTELLKRWEPTLNPDELPAMISTYDVATPDAISGYKVLIATVLIDEVNDERVIGLFNLVGKALREQAAQHGVS